MHPCFSILGQNFEYVRAISENASQPHKIFLICVLGLRTNQKNLFKVIWRELRQGFIMGTKNNLNWDFFVVSYD